MKVLKLICLLLAISLFPSFSRADGPEGGFTMYLAPDFSSTPAKITFSPVESGMNFSVDLADSANGTYSLYANNFNKSPAFVSSVEISAGSGSAIITSGMRNQLRRKVRFDDDREVTLTLKGQGHTYTALMPKGRGENSDDSRGGKEELHFKVLASSDDSQIGYGEFRANGEDGSQKFRMMAFLDPGAYDVFLLNGDQEVKAFSVRARSIGTSDKTAYKCPTSGSYASSCNTELKQVDKANSEFQDFNLYKSMKNHGGLVGEDGVALVNSDNSENKPSKWDPFDFYLKFSPVGKSFKIRNGAGTLVAYFDVPAAGEGEDDDSDVNKFEFTNTGNATAGFGSKLRYVQRDIAGTSVLFLTVDIFGGETGMYVLEKDSVTIAAIQMKSDGADGEEAHGRVAFTNNSEMVGRGEGAAKLWSYGSPSGSYRVKRLDVDWADLTVP